MRQGLIGWVVLLAQKLEQLLNIIADKRKRTVVSVVQSRASAVFLPEAGIR